MNATLAEALRLADLGYAVFPCAPGDKIPLRGTSGFKDASTDPDAIERMFAAAPANCNLAMSAAGLLILDIDPLKDGSANPWPGSERLLGLTDGPFALTPRGKHFVFKLPDGKQFILSAGKLAAAADIRTTGGYIVVAPSIVNGKSYQWQNALGCEPDKLPLPPAWLIELLDAAGKPTIATAGNLSGFDANQHGPAAPILEGGRDDELTRIGGRMRYVGLDQDAIAAALKVVNQKRCRPPLDDAQVEKIARSLERYEPGKIIGAEKTGANDRPNFEWRTSAELAASDDKVEYLIDDLVPARQGGIIGGRSKSLKTSVGIDAMISAASGSNCLGRFNVSRPVAAGLMSAESGWPTLKERGIAIAKSKGIELAGISNLVWSTASPRLALVTHLDEMRRVIEEKNLEVLGVDPTYMAMLDIGDSSANLFSMGSILSPLTKLIEDTGCSILLFHHARKGRGHALGNFDPPELSELSMAGFAEWARFWLLLGARKEWDSGLGRHWLWLNAGGSAGHAGLWHLDVTEGKPSDPGGRQWDVSVVGATEGRKAEQAGKELAKSIRDGDAEADRRQRIIEAVREIGPETKTAIRIRTGINGQRFEETLSELLTNGTIVAAFKNKNGRLHDAFQLAV
ncbi:MAG TPA: bifunctional DNA primase/polymerase [Pirellulales bacterium]|jgi:hypothetical protein|nr:bifunctional DNA primase/polymerase [Pirellulales bacterium]